MWSYYSWKFIPTHYYIIGSSLVSIYIYYDKSHTMISMSFLAACAERNFSLDIIHLLFWSQNFHLIAWRLIFWILGAKFISEENFSEFAMITASRRKRNQKICQFKKSASLIEASQSCILEYLFWWDEKKGQYGLKFGLNCHFWY